MKARFICAACLFLLVSATSPTWINMNYGDLKPYNGHCFVKKNHPSFFQSQVVGKNLSCSVMYWSGKVDPKTYVTQKVFLSMYSADSPELARDFVLAKTAQAIDRHQMIDKFKGKKYLYFDINPYVRAAQWTSGKIIVDLNAHNFDIPMEILNDYLNLYPPQMTFTADDLDQGKLAKRLLREHMRQIRQMDDQRGTINRLINKKGEAKLIIEQCHSERTVRCWLGMCDASGQSDCPITRMPDDDEREKNWKLLEQEIPKRDIVLKNVDWYQFQGQCPAKIDIHEWAKKELEID